MMVWRESSAPSASVEEDELLFVKLDDTRGVGTANLRGVECNGRGVNVGGGLTLFSAVV